MLIVHAQVHIWGADTPDWPWPPRRAADAQKPYPVTRTSSSPACTRPVPTAW
jgi:hypothetical protein